MADMQRRRRRRQVGGPTPGHEQTATAAESRPPLGLPTPPPPRSAQSPVTYDTGRDGRVDERDIERGLRGLVGGGASQVGVSAAMRARDASRPSEADLAAAEADLVIVRRNWTPREPR